MQILSFLFIPLFFILVSIYIQLWMDKDEFSQVFKMLGFGILFGIIINFILSLINSFYHLKANVISILLKSLFFDGILVSILIVITFFIIIELLMDVSTQSVWSVSSIMAFGYISGYLLVTNIVGGFNKQYPDSVFIYFSHIALLIFMSIALGFSYSKFSDSFSTVAKIIWFISIILILSMFFGVFKILSFFNLSYIYFFIIPFVAVTILFEIFDFRDYRNS